MRKLLYVITQAEFGGAQRAVFELARGLRDRYEMVVAAGEVSGSDELLRRCEAAGIRTVRLRYLRRAIRPISDIRAVFELRRLIRTERPDIIHTHSTKAGVLAALVGYTLHATRYTLLYTAHGWVFQEPLNPLRRAAYLWMERIAARRRNATIVLSESEKSVALRHGLGTEKTIHVIPNGVRCPPDLFPREEARRELAKFVPVDLSARIVGCVSNLYRTKAIDVLVGAVERLGSSDAKFVIIGAGPEQEHIARDIRARGLSDFVLLAGAVPDAGRLLSAFDLFVLPSRKEGLPFALLDAAAAGVPTVATSIGGITEVLRDGVDALLVPPDDPRALADALAHLLADSPLSARLATSARNRVCSSFALGRMIDETSAIYNHLVSQ